MKMREIIFLLCTLAFFISKIETQAIDTKSYDHGMTTGNKNSFMYKKSGNTRGLYGLVPAQIHVPLVIESGISDFVKTLDELLDTQVLDIAGIDAKVSFIIPQTPRFTKKIGFQTRRR
jgi:hypothetical protein